jgi:hypothetical protein
MYTRWRGRVALLCFAALLTLACPVAAEPSELERLQQCSRDLCDIIRTPSAGGEPLQCDLSRTWYKDDLDKAARSKGLAWLFGDAHCTLKLDIVRSILSKALAEDTYALKIPDQPASCEVEYKGERYPIQFTVAPLIEFRDGQATSVALGVKDIKANAVITALFWSATKLQDGLGLYQDDLVREVNRYVERQCRARPSGRRQVLLGTPAR